MTHAPTTLKATEPADLLSFVPHLLGALPSRSVVLIPFVGKRATGALRADLPAPGADVTGYAWGLVDMVASVPDMTHVMLVIYTDTPIVDAMPQWHPLVEAVYENTLAVGLDLFQSLCVAGDGWADFADRDTIHDVVPSPAAIPGMASPVTVEAKAALPDVDDARREAILDAMTTGAINGPHVARPDLTGVLEAALGHTDALPVDVLAELALILREPPSRDVALVQWLGDAEEGHRAQDYQYAFLEGSTTAAPPLFPRVLGMGPAPDRARIVNALDVARQVAATAPVPVGAGALVICAWLSWALGQSSTAHAYLAQVPEGSSASSMGAILRELVDGGHLPDWCFHRR